MFVGLDNYIALVGDEQFHTGVVNSFVFTAYAEVFKVVLGLIAALLLHHLRRGRAVLAGLLLLPWVVPTVVTAFSWRSLFDPIFGSVNMLLTDSGIGPLLAASHLVDSWPAGWLSDPSLAMPSVILVNVWKGMPFFTVTFLAGLKAIPADLYEAAIIDGASPWQRFVHVTLPGLRHVMIVTVILSSIWTFNNFDLIWLLTQGGPGDATAPYVLVAYSKAILQLQFGAGAAVTLVMLPIIGVLVFVLVRLMRRSDAGTGDLGRSRLDAGAAQGAAVGRRRGGHRSAGLGVAAHLLEGGGGPRGDPAARGGGRAGRLGAPGRAGQSPAVVAWCRAWGPGSRWPGCSSSCSAPLYWITVTAFKSEGQIVMRDQRPVADAVDPGAVRRPVHRPSRSAAGTSTRCWCPRRPPRWHWSAPPWPATRWPGCGSAGRRASPSRCCSPT